MRLFVKKCHKKENFLVLFEGKKELTFLIFFSEILIFACYVTVQTKYYHNPATPEHPNRDYDF